MTDNEINYAVELRSWNELVKNLNLPEYLRDVFIEDYQRREAIRNSIEALALGGRIILTGVMGSGKTALLAMICWYLMQRGYKIYFLKENKIPTNEHLRHGGILLYDDLPKLPKELLATLHKIDGFIATVRKEDIHKLERIAPKLLDNSKIIEIPEMSKENLEKMLERYAIKSGIIVTPEAKKIIVKKALTRENKGLPQFIWLVIWDAMIEGKKQITREYARRIPDRIYDYIESIIWRCIKDAKFEERVAILTILRIMIDYPGYLIEKRIIHEIHEKLLGRRRGEALSNIMRYLRTLDSLVGIPHDSWVDIILGKIRVRRFPEELEEAHEKYKEILESNKPYRRTITTKLMKYLERLLTIGVEERTQILRIQVRPRQTEPEIKILKEVKVKLGEKEKPEYIKSVTDRLALFTTIPKMIIFDNKLNKITKYDDLYIRFHPHSTIVIILFLIAFFVVLPLAAFVSSLFILLFFIIIFAFVTSPTHNPYAIDANRIYSLRNDKLYIYSYRIHDKDLEGSFIEDKKTYI